LSRLFGTTAHFFIYTANGHGAWQAALTNVLSRGDKILVLESGRFSRFAVGWGEAARLFGRTIRQLSPAHCLCRSFRRKYLDHRGTNDGFERWFGWLNKRRQRYLALRYRLV
jgi:hypothetical protein